MGVNMTYRGIWLIAAYIATIPAANWLIHHVGTVCTPDVCLIPVFPGVMSPSGVLMIGLALVLRDLVQFTYGKAVSIACILAGAGVSFLIAPPALAIASGAAFLLSELIDFMVYTPLAQRRWMLAVTLSSIVGSIADSIVFLLLAFGSLQFLLGQVLGKTWMVLAAMAVLWLIRSRMIRPSVQ